MTKIQIYNQKILAILGTLTIVGFAVIIISALVMILSEFIIKNNNRNLTDNSLTLDNSSKNQIVKDSISINQKITFENPRLIDTLKTIYLIPISQVNIQNERNGNYEEPQLLNSRYKFSKGGRNSYYRYNGEYNNIIIYNQEANTKTEIFDKKIFITKFRNIDVKSIHYLFITGSAIDSNKDNKLNDIDLKSFFIYDIEKESLKEVSFNHLGFENFYLENETEKLLLRYTVDDNKDGKINSLQEPVIIKEFDLSTGKIIDFIDDKRIKKLTHLIN